MAKQRKQKSSVKNSTPVSDEIPEDEQWRIIEESGLLKKIPREKYSSPDSPKNPPAQDEEDLDAELCSPLCNEIFNSILYLIPFSSLYIMMEILAHRQYAQEITAIGLLEKIIWAIPFLSIFIFFTLRHKTEWRMQALLFLLSIMCGSRLVYIVNWASWKVIMKQCAPLGTVWVYTIAQLNLLPAVGALGVVAAYVQWKDLKIIM